MATVTWVRDALNGVTYCSHGDEYVTEVIDARGSQRASERLDHNQDATGYAAYFRYDSNGQRSYAGNADGRGAYCECDANGNAPCGGPV